MWLEVAVFIAMMVGTMLLTAALCSAIFMRRLDRVRAQKEKLARSQEDFRLKYLAQAKDYETLHQRYKALDLAHRKDHMPTDVTSEPTVTLTEATAEVQSQLLEAQTRCKQCENEKKLLLSALEDLQEQLAHGSGSSVPQEIIPLSTKDEVNHRHQTVKVGERDNKEAVFARIKDRAASIDFARIGRVAAEDRDDLQRIKGIGPHIEQKLNSAGIYSLRQISQFTVDDEKLVNDVIEFFPGRISRDQWVAQASQLLDEE